MNLEKVLKIENAIIAEYLYNKLAEVGKAGITVRYKVELHRECPISEVQLTETIGYLFDRAMEKLVRTEFLEKKIYFKLQQKEKSVTVKFAYTSEMMSADQVIEMWNNHREKAALYRLEGNNGKVFVTMKTVDDANYLCVKVKLPYETKEEKYIFHIHKVDSL